MGGISFLRSIPVTEIFEIRHSNAPQPQLEWGHSPQGIIQADTAGTSTSSP